MSEIPRREWSPIHERLMHALNALHDTSQIKYIIEILNESEIGSYRKGFVLVFLLMYYHPQIMLDSQKQKLEEFCQDSLHHSTTNQLLQILNEPYNTHVKDLFDQFVEYYCTEEKRPGPSRRS